MKNSQDIYPLPIAGFILCNIIRYYFVAMLETGFSATLWYQKILRWNSLLGKFNSSETFIFLKGHCPCVILPFEGVISIMKWMWLSNQGRRQNFPKGVQKILYQNSFFPFPEGSAKKRYFAERKRGTWADLEFLFFVD